MSQITNSRKGRIIRRAVAVILFVVAPASYLAYSLTRTDARLSGRLP